MIFFASYSPLKLYRKIGLSRSIGLGLLSIIIISTVIGPDLVGHDPAKQDLLHARQMPNAVHLLGTDHLGRDMAARLLSGARLSLSLGILSLVTAAFLGISLGIIAAWFGTWTDRFLTSFADAILALPGLLLVLILMASAPGSWWLLYIGISLTLWVEFFRYTRQRSRIILAHPSVDASKNLGLSNYFILTRHIFPELRNGLFTISAFGIASAITAIAALGFVSVGIRPPMAEWGLMMTQLLPYWREAPFLILQPIICLVLTILSLHLSVGGFHKK